MINNPIISPERVTSALVSGHSFQGTYLVNMTSNKYSTPANNDRYGSTLKKKVKENEKKISNHRVDIGSLPNQNQSYMT